jgi:PIN domain nuclease of toxin-antitoxin system
VASVAHLDTHVVAWLYAGELSRIPAAARSVVERASLAVSPIVALELAYLHEIERLTVGPDVILDALDRQLGLRVDDSPFASVVVAATALTWTRDPFDRLIAAQAAVAAETLVTADRTIREHVRATTWA